MKFLVTSSVQCTDCLRLLCGFWVVFSWEFITVSSSSTIHTGLFSTISKSKQLSGTLHELMLPILFLYALLTWQFYSDHRRGLIQRILRISVKLRGTLILSPTWLVPNRVARHCSLHMAYISFDYTLLSRFFQVNINVKNSWYRNSS